MTVPVDVRIQVLSAFLAGEAVSRSCRNLRITEDLYRQILADAGFPDRGRVERARTDLLDQWTAQQHPSAHAVPAAAPTPRPPASAVEVVPIGGLVEVAVRDLDVDPENLRADLGDIHGLAMSIRTVGLLQPIVARRTAGGRLVIVAGHRRHAAVQLLGWDKVQVLVRRPMAPDEVLAAMLIENGQRAGLDPIEEARALNRLRIAGNLTSSEVAKRVGLAQSTVDGRLTLLELPIEEQEALRAGELTITNAVRQARVASGRVRRPGYTGHPHLGLDHDLARLAKARCARLQHRQHGRNSVGGVACGACWESVIRADERRHLATSVASGARCPTCGLGAGQ